MFKKSLTSLELAALTNELQCLVEAKISQIYHEGEEFLFQLHTREGKRLLRVLPGRLLNITKIKKAFPKPSGLSLQLRKYLDNAYIRKIEQKEAERILIFELEKEEKYFLIIELLTPGNLILADQNYRIMACLHSRQFRDRLIKPQEKYQFPPPVLNWKTLTSLELQEILKKSKKKNLVTALATEVGLGGLYAEEVCKLNHLDKEKLPGEISGEETKRMVQTLKNFLQQMEKPQGFIYPEQITPFPLKDLVPLKKTETYSEALESLGAEVVSPQKEKIQALKRTLQRQEEALKKYQAEIEINTQKAELIYQNYQPIQKLLAIVEELKKNKSWGEIEEELKKVKKIKKIDLKNKKITLDLE